MGTSAFKGSALRLCDKEAIDLEKPAAGLKETYPEGVGGKRESLVALLVQKGYPQAQELARALEAQGYAHSLPGEQPRWAFIPFPEALRLWA